MSTSVVMKARRKKLAEITSGKITSMAAVTHVAVGDGGVNDANEPRQPNEAQTALFHELKRYPIEEIAYPIETTARYVVTIPEPDLIGAKISEIGLIDADGVLCAMKTMYVKQKDAHVKFTFEFDDEF